MALAVGAALVLVGCGPSVDWTGEWRGHREVPAPPGTDPSVAESLALVKLTVTPDGRFKLNEEGFTKEGNVIRSGQSATLKIDRVLGRAIGNLGPEAEAMGGERKLTAKTTGIIAFERPGSETIELKRAPSQ